MLSDAASITEETLDIQVDCVRNTRFNSRKVSGGGTLLGDLAMLKCRIRLLWGVGDDSPFRPADLLIGEIRQAVGAFDVHRIPRAGHGSAYENAPEVNRLMLEFFRAEALGAEGGHDLTGEAGQLLDHDVSRRPDRPGDHDVVQPGVPSLHFL
jgi:hypothetical protein